MALPKYPEIKQPVEKLLWQYFERKAREQMGPFHDAKQNRQYEGETARHNTLDDSEKMRDIDYKEASVEYEFSNDEIRSGSLQSVMELLEEKAKDFGGQQARHSFAVLDKVIRESGNTLEAGAQQLSGAIILDALEKISMSFDEDGTPHKPTFVSHPSQLEKSKAAFDEIEADPVLRKRHEDIIARKKQEYDAEQARRKLVD